MLKNQINFVYEDKQGNVTRRSLTNYSVSKSNNVVYITGQDSLRANAIRRFLRNQILLVSKEDETKDECDKCGGKYQDNRDFVIEEHTLATFCRVCESEVHSILDIRGLF